MPNNNMEDYEFMVDLLAFTAEHDIFPMWNKTDGFPPIAFFINTNDLFAWGCADCEPVTAETFPALKQAVEECRAIVPTWQGAQDGCALYACRRRRQRPQGAMYPEPAALWPLFDACGPERPVGLGNPYCHPSQIKKETTDAD